MFNAGDIVLQKETMVNGKNCKDNKKDRLSVILFNIEIDDKKYVCSCPITNRKIHLYSKPDKFLYIPYQILSDSKLCTVKLDSAFIYPEDEITFTGLKLNKETVLKLYNAILNLEVDLNKEHYEIIKNNIRVLANKISEEEKRKIKEEKKLRKKLRNEKRKEFKKHN